MAETKIVILDGQTTNPGDLSWEDLEKLGRVTVYDDTSHDDQELIIERIADAEIVLTNKVPLTQFVLEHVSNLKYITVMATGVNNIDINAASSQGIFVSNIPSYSTMSVAQLTFSHLLEIAQRVGHHSKEVSNGRWEKVNSWTFYDFPLMELDGKTMGIIGFGDIGQATGRIAREFGMNVVAYSRSQSESGKKIADYVTKEELFATADIISLHIPLTKDTEEIINKETISQMKDSVILINTARGPLLNEEDVANALESGKIYAAGLDVAREEPMKSSNPLLKAKNCFITPHIGWATKESRQRLLEKCVANVQHYLKEDPINLVNDSN